MVQPGNYSYYLEKRKEREARDRQWLAAGATSKSSSAPKTAAAAAPTAESETSGKSGRPRKLSFKEQRELAGMEETILTVEGRVAELEALLNDPSFYVTQAREASGLLAELEDRKAEVARLYARWQELDSLPR